MNKILLTAVAIIALTATTNAQQDLAASLSVVTAGSTVSDDPVDFSFNITNNGTLIPTGDTLYFAVSIGTTYYTVDDWTADAVSGTILTADFANGETVGVTVATQTMQEMYEKIGGLSGNVCGIAVGVGSASVNNGFADDATALDNLSCATYEVTAVAGTEENNITEISAYPNPVASLLNFDLGNNQANVINIIDMTGRVVNSINVVNNLETIDVSAYENGIYFYQVVTEGTVVKTEKFIVSK